jgi:teichuronic acid biosynthesis glycosyltransferase TuaH
VLVANKGIVFFGASSAWTFSIAMEMSKLTPVTAIEFSTSNVLTGSAFRWPYKNHENIERCEVWKYPPGFNGALAPIYNKRIKARLNRLVAEMEKLHGLPPFLFTPYPWYSPYLEDISSTDIVYYNYDDYFAYSSSRNHSRERQEERLVKKAGTIFCSSIYQTTRFKKKYAIRQHDIFHIPHGVSPIFFNLNPAKLSRANTVSLIGGQIQRLDWDLINEVISSLSRVEFVFVGFDEILSNKKNQKTDVIKKIFSRFNVVKIPTVEQDKVPLYYRNSAINWIPYDITSPFNAGCCPTKIMDGLASGQPMISADLAECRLYPEWVNIYKNVDEAVNLITKILEKADKPSARILKKKQIDFVRKNTWAIRAKRVVGILERD